MSPDPITHEALSPLQHGFFTRVGGVSTGLYAGLNCGRGSADRAELVAENRTGVAGVLGITPDALNGLHQVHSATVITLADNISGGLPRADALVTATPGIALSVLSADCQPVLFADRDAGVVGAAHAGWKGTVGGVLESTLDAMEALGAMRSRIVTIIGPTISQRAYEVGPEYLDRVLAEDPESERYFAGGAGDRYHFDLPGYGLFRLREAGVGLAEWTGHCTFSDPARFFSYRRSQHAKEPDYGRQIAAIRL